MSIELLIEKLKNNTITIDEVDKLTRNFMKIAETLASVVAPRNQTEEYTSVANYILAKALNLAAEKLYNNNFEVWLKFRIYKHLKRFRIEDQIIKIPYQSLMRNIKENIKPLKRVPLTDHICNDETKVELDFITDPEDQIIADLRIQGYTDKEIGNMISKSTSYVQKRRTAIQEQYIKSVA